MSEWLIIRADAQAAIGTGHVMRCLALAQAWLRQGGRCCFVCKNPLASIAHRITAAGCDLYDLEGDVMIGGIVDAKATIAHAKTLSANWLVVDGYQFNAAYQQQIKDAKLSLLFLDDYGHCDFYTADLILNQNIYASESLYSKRSANTKLLLGCDYALLREEFRSWIGWKREIKQVATKLLITLGGGDPDNQTMKVLQSLKSVDISLQVTVLVGAVNPHRAELETAVQDLTKHDIQLLHNATNMPELIAASDLAICAGGSTNWEMAFLGLPTIIIIVAENQRLIANQLHKQNIAINLGWFETVQIVDIKDRLLHLIQNYGLMREMSRNGQTMVDGQGDERVLAAILRKPENESMENHHSGRQSQ